MNNLSRRQLRLFRWCLIAVCGLCLVFLFPVFAGPLIVWFFMLQDTSAEVSGIIGGADGPTVIITATRTLGPLETFLEIGLPFILLIVCIVLAVKVWRLEKKLK